MDDKVTFKVTGTKGDLDGFMRSLEYEPDLEVLATARRPRPGVPDAELGQLELLELVISFALGVAGNATYDQIKHAYQKYASKRSHMRLEEVSDEEAREIGLPDDTAT